jgi:tripartite-type tricarboxylate transporter receptor subunit TctC
MTRQTRIVRGAFAALLAGATAAAAAAQADEVADFYKGNTISVIISTGVGGSNNVNARLLMEHMVRHIPGKPDYVAKNMPGGGHVRATNYLYNVAPQDGTYIGAVVRFFVLHQALGGTGVRYDARKFNYLGATGSSNVVGQAWKTSGVTSIRQVMERELIVGGTGVGSGTVMFPSMLNALAGTRFKIVSGYKSGHEIDLAMERGEVGGRLGNTFESLRAINPAWLTKDGPVSILVQIGLEKEPGFPDIPLALDLVRTGQDRKVMALFSGIVSVGSPIFTNQGVPRARAEALRKAFAATMKDPAYLAATKKARFDIQPKSAAKLHRIVTDILDAPPEVIARAKAALGRKGLVDCKTFTKAQYCRSGKRGKKKKS